MKYLIFIMSLSLIGACQTMGPDGRPIESAPEITDAMTIEEVVDAGIRFGGETLVVAKRHLNKNKSWPEALKVIELRVKENRQDYTNLQLISALHMYQSGAKAVPLDFFRLLVRSKRATLRDLGWTLAANLPSASLRKAIDDELSRYVIQGLEQEILSAHLANAVQANKVRTAYTLMREGLMKTGDDSFAKAMISIKPQQSSEDFLPYLATAPVEELRQLNQRAVNIYSCMVILRHLISYPVSINHPNFEHLFLYAISRNNGLSELANLALDVYLPRYRNHMALMLSRLPAWIQVAFVESSRHRMSPHTRSLLAELKGVTSHDEVVDEITAIR